MLIPGNRLFNKHNSIKLPYDELISVETSGQKGTRNNFFVDNRAFLRLLTP